MRWFAITHDGYFILFCFYLCVAATYICLVLLSFLLHKVLGYGYYIIEHLNYKIEWWLRHINFVAGFSVRSTRANLPCRTGLGISARSNYCGIFWFLSCNLRLHEYWHYQYSRPLGCKREGKGDSQVYSCTIASCWNDTRATYQQIQVVSISPVSCLSSLHSLLDLYMNNASPVSSDLQSHMMVT